MEQSNLFDPQDLIKNFKISNCSKKSPGHSENQLNQICMDFSCPKMLEPVCIQCIEDDYIKSGHKHSNNFKSLKTFVKKMTEFAPQVGNEGAKLYEGLDQHKQVSSEWFMTYTKLFKNLEKKIQTIVSNLEAMGRYFKDSIGENNDCTAQQKKNHPTNLRIKNILQQISDNNGEDQELLTYQLQQFSKMITQKNGEIVLAAPPKIENDKEIYQKLQIYQNQMEKGLSNLESLANQVVEGSVKNGERWDTLQKGYGEEEEQKKLGWKFVASEWQGSKNIYVQKKDKTLYSGADGMMGVLYSDRAFNEGKHYFKLKIKKLESSSTKLFIGLIPDNKKDDQPGTGNPHQFLYGDQSCRMVRLTDQQLGDIMQDGDTIRVVLDLKRNNFYIRDQNGTPFYEVDQKYDLKTMRWRFSIFGYWHDLQVELMESE